MLMIFCLFSTFLPLSFLFHWHWQVYVKVTRKCFVLFLSNIYFLFSHVWSFSLLFRHSRLSSNQSNPNRINLKKKLWWHTTKTYDVTRDTWQVIDFLSIWRKYGGWWVLFLYWFVFVLIVQIELALCSVRMNRIRLLWIG